MISNKASHKTERRKNMTNNKKNYFDFANDKQLSKYAYENAKVFLIASEKKESIYTNYVSDFNYFIVGKVLSMDETRKNHFEMNVEDKQNDTNKLAYQWLKVNASLENYSYYILDCFKNVYVIDDKNALCWEGYFDWIRSKSNNNGKFTFFGDSKDALTV